MKDPDTTRPLFCTIDREGAVVQRDLSLQEAARKILTYDGAKYELRPAARRPGLDLWVSNASGALVKSIFWSDCDDADAAEYEIARDVVRSGMFKLDAQNQHLYDAEQAQLAAEGAA